MLKEIKIASHSVSVWPVVTNVLVDLVDDFWTSSPQLLLLQWPCLLRLGYEKNRQAGDESMSRLICLGRQKVSSVAAMRRRLPQSGRGGRCSLDATGRAARQR